jgi:hypothetical protein
MFGGFPALFRGDFANVAIYAALAVASAFALFIAHPILWLFTDMGGAPQDRPLLRSSGGFGVLRPPSPEPGASSGCATRGRRRAGREMKLMQPEQPAAVSSYLEWSDRGKTSIPQYMIGLLLIVVAFSMLGAIGTFPVTLIDPDYTDSLLESNLVLLLTFVVPFVAIPLVTQLLHSRPYWSVGLAQLRFEAWNLWSGFLVSIAIGFIAFLILWALGTLGFEWVGFDWSQWLPLAVIGAVGIFIQAGTEEMLFRGYLTQFVRRMVKHPAVFLTVPAVLFAVPHIANVAALGGGPLVMVPYFASGLLYGWAAWRTGSLWMALGLHWSNNLTGLLLVGNQEDVLKSVAPVQTTVPGLATTTLIVVAQSVASVVVLTLLIRRREARIATRPTATESITADQQDS